MSGDKANESAEKTETEVSSDTQESAVAVTSGAGSPPAGGAAPPPAPPAIRHHDAEVREAYRNTFNQEAGAVEGPGPAGVGGGGGLVVTVRDPREKAIPGYGSTRDAAFDDLIAKIKTAGPPSDR